MVDSAKCKRCYYQTIVAVLGVAKYAAGRRGLGQFGVALIELVPEVIDDLVRVCVIEHRDNNLPPDKVGKRESTYVQCYDKVQLHLLETRTG
jgi:hypothetical protein